MKTQTLFLASQSPRRIAILKAEGFHVEKIENKLEVEDEFDTSKSIQEQVEKLAFKKAMLSKEDYKGLIVAADTIVVFQNTCLGKPESLADAHKMLTLLSGNTHEVISGVALINTLTGKTKTLSDTTKVTFNALTKEEITEYVNTYRPLDKSGSYGIQELPRSFIKEINGSMFNVVGFPIEKALKEIDLLCFL